MRIAFVEISNFRKLRAVRVEFTDSTTLFVGANNSGKTSAMVALRHFLVDRGKISTYDFTLSLWQKINSIGAAWETGAGKNPAEPPTLSQWGDTLPSLDVWLDVASSEIHYVSKLLPTLEWKGGLIGVRLRFEPKDVVELHKQYLTAINDAKKAKEGSGGKSGVKLWPQNMVEFLERQMRSLFTVRGYVLDPTKCVPAQNGIAKPQPLPHEAEPLEGDPFDGLIRIDEISAQRGFSDSAAKSDLVPGDGAKTATRRESRRLSEQLRAYYADHLDPFDSPDPSDLVALKAIEDAQAAFDERLESCFQAALKEVQGLGYPGVTDPRLKISTRIRPADGLDHDSAVQYLLDSAPGGTPGQALLLPEDYNGLGYQNLISIVFRLMSFRDAWMRVGKAGKSRARGTEIEKPLPPLHLVLVEEPEAHLHAQVQQVFIRKAYAILRAHPDLGESASLTTQLVVSTHSSHVAHETAFECLRYFRRLPANAAGDVPISTVVNLSEVFGKKDETQRFVTRYLRATHCDLFFADAAILVEGPAERILIPHFIRTHFSTLHQCYITLLEIGGSHAHRLEPLIKHLGLLTLIVTDLDASNASTKKAEPPARAKSQITANATLRTWAPKETEIDKLLDLTEAAKILTYDPLSCIRVAYQCPVKITIGKKENIEALPSTFEDALVLENLPIFSALDGTGLIAKFRDAIKAHNDVAALGQALFESLRDGKKAEFALEMLELSETDKLRVPIYIDEGLKWLESQLKKKQEVVIVAVPEPPKQAAKAIA
ncbi:MAG TPA: AAA family ATPase [Pseudolabrys sp.]|nr:AAA family ATPase [Pseudolabrys sp.]